MHSPDGQFQRRGILAGVVALVTGVLARSSERVARATNGQSLIVGNTGMGQIGAQTATATTEIDGDMAGYVVYLQQLNGAGGLLRLNGGQVSGGPGTTAALIDGTSVAFGGGAFSAGFGIIVGGGVGFASGSNGGDGVSATGGTGDVHGGNGVSGFGGRGNPAANNGVGVAGFGGGLVGSRAAGVAGTTSSSTSPGVLATNTGSGPGVVGNATSGIGVRGVSTSGNGVFGQADSSAGVWGTANAAPGTGGQSLNNYGVYGVSTNSIGVGGVSGPSFGVYGASTSSDGVRGQSTSGFGLHGVSSNSNGVYGEGGGANAGVAGVGTTGPGVYGQTTSGAAVFAIATSGTGVYGTSSSGLAGWFVGPVQVNGAFTVVGGPKSAAVPHPDGSYRRLYCLECPESWFEDFGRGQLVNGRAQVRLDPDFAVVVQSDDYDVFLTSEGDHKGLYISSKSPRGFEVRECQGGTSNLPIAYRVVARRKDIASQRLERVVVAAMREPPRAPERAQSAAPDQAPRVTPPAAPPPVPPAPEPHVPTSAAPR